MNKDEGRADVDDLEKELNLTEQELKEQAEKDVLRKQIKGLVHPLQYFVIDVLKSIEDYARGEALENIREYEQGLRILILDPQSRIKYVTPAVKTTLGYGIDEDIPLMDQVYSTLMYHDLGMQFKTAVKEKRKIRQRVVLDHKEGNRVHLESVILDHICSARGALVGTIIGWSNVHMPFLTDNQRNKIKK